MTLPEIATEIKKATSEAPNIPIRRQLPGGLRLIALDTITKHRLSLVREGVTPSARDIEIVRRDFGIPNEAKLEREQRRAGGRTFYIVRLVWSRATQLTMDIFLANGQPGQNRRTE